MLPLSTVGQSDTDSDIDNNWQDWSDNMEVDISDISAYIGNDVYLANIVGTTKDYRAFNIKFTKEERLSNAAANGYDIRFVDKNGDAIRYYRDAWEGGGGKPVNAEFTIKLDKPIGKITLYWGNPNAVDVAMSICQNPSGSDKDKDGIDDACDNCPEDSNKEQKDSDGDNIGDACDSTIKLSQSKTTEEKRREAEEKVKQAIEEKRRADEEKTKQATAEKRRADEEKTKQATAEKKMAAEKKTKQAAEEKRREAEEKVKQATEEKRRAAEEAAKQTGDDAGGGGGFGGLDSDSDGIIDTSDNCPNLRNNGQEDYDEDGVGNACDNCPGVSRENKVFFIFSRTDNSATEKNEKSKNPDQKDSDGDGIGDACDDTLHGAASTEEDQQRTGEDSPVREQEVEQQDIEAEIESEINQGFFSIVSGAIGGMFRGLW